MIREPERRFRRECEEAELAVQAYDESPAGPQLFDIARIRLRFRVTGPDDQSVNVRFNPATMQFRWPPGGNFTWSQLMFEPQACIAMLRRDLAPMPAKPEPDLRHSVIARTLVCGPLPRSLR